MTDHGHNGVASDQLRSFVERIERIEAEISELNSDKSDIYKEARGNGFDVKVLRKVVAKRKVKPTKREEEDAIFDLYWHALHGPVEPKPLVRARTREIIEEIPPQNEAAEQVGGVAGDLQRLNAERTGRTRAYAKGARMERGIDQGVTAGETAPLSYDPETGEIITESHSNVPGLPAADVGASTSFAGTEGDEDRHPNFEMDRDVLQGDECTCDVPAENARKAITAQGSTSPEDGSVNHAGAGESPATNSASVAQRKEHEASNLGVAGSNPAGRAKVDHDEPLAADGRPLGDDIPDFLKR